MTLKTGDILLMAPPGGKVCKHYTIVLTENPRSQEKSFFLVSITSIYPEKFHDPACVLNAGDHHCLIHPSYVKYDEIYVQTEGNLLTKIGNGIINYKGSLEESVLERVMKGGVDSDHIREGKRVIFNSYFSDEE